MTLVSVGSAILFAYFLAEHNYLLAGLSWVGVIFDALDGYVARKKGKVTQFGAFFDSTMDRIADFCYITAFGFAGLISWPFVSLVLLTSFLISYTKARGESLLPKDVVIKEGFMQRTERVALLFIVFLLFLGQQNVLGVIVYIALLVFNTITFFQRMRAVKNLL